MIDTDTTKSSIRFLEKCLEICSNNKEINFALREAKKEFYKENIEAITSLWLSGVLVEYKFRGILYALTLNKSKEFVKRYKKYKEIELKKLQAMLLKNNQKNGE